MPTARVRGVEQLQRKLFALPQAVRDEIKKAMEEGAKEIVAMAQRLVPIGDTGNLRASIGWTWGAAPGGSITLAQGRSQAAGGDKLTIYAGNDQAFYVRWVEFGSVRQAAQPFFYPSYRALRSKMRSRTNRAIRTAARRVAAKT